MPELRVGVMGCSSFARRAMLPALKECDGLKLVAIASRSQQKAREFATEFDALPVHGYEELVKRDDIDAIYMPLPTGLHEQWIVSCIEAGKHLLVEKSFAESAKSAEKMARLASDKKVFVQENFLFPNHSQWTWITDVVKSGKLGDIHLVRSTFGFPPLPRDNFRFNASLGGGVLLDAGAYVLKVSQLLLGFDLEVNGSSLQYDKELAVDIYGQAMLQNSAGQVSQVAFGFNYFYQCNLEILGTKGKLTADRIFTPPPGFNPTVTLESQGEKDVKSLEADNHYVNMWNNFAAGIEKDNYKKSLSEILSQAQLIEQLKNKAVVNTSSCF